MAERYAAVRRRTAAQDRASITLNSNRRAFQSALPRARVVPTPAWYESLLFVALMSGPPKFRVRDMNASLSGDIDSVVLVHLAVWACGAVWVLRQLYPTLFRSAAIPRLSAVQFVGAVFIAELCVSIPRAPGPMLTAFVLSQFAILLAFAAVFVGRFGVSTYFKHMFAGVFVLVMMVCLAVVTMPDLVLAGGMGRFRGDLFVGPGGLGVIGLVLCLSNTPQLKWYVFWPMIALSGLLLAASQTRTCYVALIAYLVIGAVCGRGLRVRKLVPLLGALVIGLLLFDELSPASEYVIRDRSTLETMSDRGPLWDFLIDQVMREQPLTGLGYFSASRVLAPMHNSSLGDAHSSFLEVIVGGGLLGAGLFLALCLMLLATAARVLLVGPNRAQAVSAVGLLSATLVMGFTSSSALHGGPVGFTFWSTTALLPALLAQRSPRAANRTAILRPRKARPVDRRSMAST